MGHGVVHIDLPEAREPLPDLLVRQDADAERRLAFHTLVECDLGTGQQADRNFRLPDRRESASNRIVEFRRHQLVLDLGRPVRDVVQTIVPHRRAVLAVKSRDFPGPPNLISSKLALLRLPWKKKDEIGHAGDVAVGSAKTGHQSNCDRVFAAYAAGTSTAFSPVA